MRARSNINDAAEQVLWQTGDRMIEKNLGDWLSTGEIEDVKELPGTKRVYLLIDLFATMLIYYYLFILYYLFVIELIIFYYLQRSYDSTIIITTNRTIYWNILIMIVNNSKIIHRVTYLKK